MLLEVNIENFLSFKEKVSFSMMADGTKGLAHNYVHLANKKILKTAAMYGANASGKSNFIKVINTVVSMLKQSNKVDINAKLPITPFKFCEEICLSAFEIKFYKDDIKYVYGFVANEDAIHEEYLYYYPNGRASKIFDRTNINEYSFPQKETKILNNIKDVTSRNKFFLSTATNWNYSKTKPAYDFLTVDLSICFGFEELSGLAFNIYNNDKDGKLKKFALDFLQKADFNIVDYKIRLIDIPKEHLSLIPDPFKDLVGKKAFNTTFTHSLDGKKFKLDYSEESVGTQTVFALIPFISLVLENRRVLLVDELDRSLHPLLVQLIVSMFNDPEINKNGAQLIFNTHDTNLLNLDILRRDQIWFVEKNDKNGSSDLFAMSDFSVRQNENIEKGYLLGRYGAIPFISLDINLW